MRLAVNWLADVSAPAQKSESEFARVQNDGEARTGFEPVIAVLQFAEPRPGLSPTVPSRPVLNCVCGRQFRSGAAAPHPVRPCWVAIGLQPWRMPLFSEA